jgi:hypothetical protein
MKDEERALLGKGRAFADRPPTSVATAAGASNDKRALEIGRARPRSSKASLARCQFTHGRFSNSHIGVVTDLRPVMTGLAPRLSALARKVAKSSVAHNPTRPARACPGHPRRAEAANFKGLLQQRRVRTNATHSPWDSRDKPGQDAERFYSTQILSRDGTF